MGRITKVLTVLVLATSLVSCGSTSDDPLAGKNITLELKTGKENIAVYNDNGIKVYDFNTQEITDATGNLMKQCNPVLKLTKDKFDIKDESKVDINNPSTLSENIKLTTPYTYTSTLKDSSAYVNYLKDKGWKEDIYGKSSSCIDMLLIKGDENKRVIITTTTLKVFENINKNYEQNLTYIIERR